MKIAGIVGRPADGTRAVRAIDSGSAFVVPLLAGQAALIPVALLVDGALLRRLGSES